MIMISSIKLYTPTKIFTRANYIAKCNFCKKASSYSVAMSVYKSQKNTNHSDLYPRILDVEVCSKAITLYQKLEGDVSCVVWDASIVLSKYLEVMSQKTENLLNGLKILELGAGVGCVGLTAATLGAEVILTDLPDTLPLLKYNISENKFILTCQGGFATAESLSWGDVDSDIIKNMTFDYVVMADCVYYEESLEPLLKTLCNINASVDKKPRLLISQELRDSDIQKGLWKVFHEKLQENFTITQIPISDQHPEYRSDDILLLDCVRKNKT